MAKYRVTGPDGGTFEVTAPDDASQEQVIAYAQKNFKLAATPKPEKPFGQQLNDAIADVPRQIGLTARHAVEGVGDTLDFLSSPIRGAINAVLPDKYAIKPGSGAFLANAANLPAPANATERIVGDGARLMAGAMVPLVGASKALPLVAASAPAEVKTAADAAKIATKAQGVAKPVLQALAANPLQQTVSAGSSGLAGGYTRETGGDDASQFVASLAAGVAAPYAMNKGQQIAGGVANLVKSKAAPSQDLMAKIDLTVNNAIRDSGYTLDDLPTNIKNGIRSDVQKAMTSGGVLSPDAIRRLADYRLTGATPTAATLTLDPAMVSQQKNLAKLGINSKDVAAQQLGQVENANNRQLVEGLNTLGANTADDAYSGGQKVIGALAARNDAAKAAIGARYDAARAANGRAAALDPAHFTQTANNLLDDALLGGKLPGDVRNLLNKTASGEMPLTVDVAEQFKTRLGDLQRSTNDMAERKALGLVRQALDNTPLLDGQGKEAVDAFNKARRLNRAWMEIVDKTPALQAVRDGVEPDKFVKDFIVGNGSNANTMDLAMLKRSVKGNPEAMDAIKSQISAYLKKAALNGAADEVGNFSQSAYNKALAAIGDRKLAIFFAPEEVAQMKAIGRVASYEQFQPRGAAVNNSNTAGSALSTILDRVANSPLLSKIPLGSQIAGPAQNISIGIKANNAMDVQRGLLAPQLAGIGEPPVGLLMSPAAFMQVDDKRKKKGLLSP